VAGSRPAARLDGPRTPGRADMMNPKLEAARRALAERPGIVAHGLPVDGATAAIVAGAQGVRVPARDGPVGGEDP
jgi:hypothetical protein